MRGFAVRLFSHLSLVAWLAAGPSVAAAGQDVPASWRISTNANAFIGSNFVAARNFSDDDWRGHYRLDGKTPLAVVTTGWEAGIGHGNWFVSRVYRNEAALRLTGDAAEVAAAYKTQSALPAGRPYTVGFELAGFEVDGIRLRHRLVDFNANDSGWQAEIAATAYRGRKARDLRGSGLVTGMGAGKYDYQLTWTDNNPKTTHPFMATGTPVATGEGLDLDLRWRPLARHELGLSLRDLGMRLSWRELPRTHARIATQASYTNSQGYIEALPSMTGLTRRGEFVQRIEPTTQLSYRYRSRNDYGVDASATHAHEVWLPRISLSGGLGAAWPRWEVGRDMFFAAYTFSLSWHGLRLGVVTDLRPIDVSRSLGLSLEFNLPL